MQNTSTLTTHKRFGTYSFYAAALRIAIAHFWLKKEKWVVNLAER